MHLVQYYFSVQMLRYVHANSASLKWYHSRDHLPIIIENRSVTSSNFNFCIKALSWTHFSRTWWKILTHLFWHELVHSGPRYCSKKKVNQIKMLKSKRTFLVTSSLQWRKLRLKDSFSKHNYVVFLLLNTIPCAPLKIIVALFACQNTKIYELEMLNLMLLLL